MTPLLLLIAAAVGLLTFHKPKTGLMLVVASLPAYLLRTELGGIPVTLIELMILAFAAGWLLKHRHLPLRQLHPLFWGVIATTLIAATLGVVVAIDTNAALGVWKAYFVEPILLALIMLTMLEEEEVKPKHLFYALRISALVVSLVAIVQWVTGHGIPIPWDIERRVTSVFDYPNALGLFLGPLTIMSTLLIKETTRKDKGLWILTSILGFISLFLAQSEAAIVAVVATLLLVGLSQASTRKPTTGLIVTLLALTLTFPPLFEKLTLQDYSGGVRRSQWSETIPLVQDHWLAGVGLSGYPTALEPYHTATQFEIFQYPHNILLNTWVELGLLGVLTLFFVGYLLVQSARQNPTSMQRIALIVLIQIAIHGLVDVPYFKNDLALLTWIFFILAMHPYARAKTRKTV